MATLNRWPAALAGGFLGIAVLFLSSSAGAVDVPVAAKRLVVKTTPSKSKVVFVAKDEAVTKGGGTDLGNITAEVDMNYDGEVGVFGIGSGAFDGTRGWKVNDDKVAKYLNKIAPEGSGSADTKVVVVKPGKLLKVVAKDLGEEPFDILAAGAPSGPVRVQFYVWNGSEEYRHCSMFTECTYKLIKGGTGAKLVCKNGLPDPLCGLEPVACGDATAPACDGACPAGQTCFTFLGSPCTCVEAAGLVEGACGEVAGAPACLGECPPDAPICIHDDSSPGGCRCSTGACGDSAAWPATCGGVCPSGQLCQPDYTGPCRCTTDSQCVASGTCFADDACLYSSDCPTGYFCEDVPPGFLVCLGGGCVGGCASCPVGGYCLMP